MNLKHFALHFQFRTGHDEQHYPYINFITIGLFITNGLIRAWTDVQTNHIHKHFSTMFDSVKKENELTKCIDIYTFAFFNLLTKGERKWVFYNRVWYKCQINMGKSMKFSKTN